MCRNINGYHFFVVKTKTKIYQVVFKIDITYSNEIMGNRTTSKVAILSNIYKKNQPKTTQ